MNQRLIYLASASPRRRQLLDQIGVHHRVHPVGVDETALPDETPRSLVERLARTKAHAAWTQLGEDPAICVLGADTMVVVDDEALGKPRDRSDCLRMLERLSGREHSVLTGVCLLDTDRCEIRVNESCVEFRVLSRDEMNAYWDTGEPADKAGAYAIQGIAGQFITGISGSFSGIMGLPVYETSQLLREAGLDPLASQRLEAAS